MDNSRICHCLLFHEYRKQNFVQPLLGSMKLHYGYTHTLTKLHNKSWAESLALMSSHYAWPLPEQTITVCDLTVTSVSSVPCLSWSAVAFSRSITMELDSEGPIVSTSTEFSKCANLKCTYLFVQLKFWYMATHTYDTHASSNAVALVWGLLSFVPIKPCSTESL